MADTRALALDFDQCAFGALSLKPTRLLCSSELPDDVQMRCPGGHRHVKLKGKMRDPQTGYWVFRTKAAQVYPWALCATMAEAIAVLYNDALAHFAPSFALTTPASDRKRPLGSGKPWLGHRQEATALKAQWAGYQLKRGAAKPLFEFELEPGQAIEFALRCHTLSLRACLWMISRAELWSGCSVMHLLSCTSVPSFCNFGNSGLVHCCPAQWL